MDPLADLAAVAEQERVWFHIDAAYGGYFQLTERGRERLAGVERADTITLDPHKTVAFRLRSGTDDDNRSWLAAINASGTVFCSSTRIAGRLTLRACVLSHRTKRADIDNAVDAIVATLPVAAG